MMQLLKRDALWVTDGKLLHSDEHNLIESLLPQNPDYERLTIC